MTLTDPEAIRKRIERIKKELTQITDMRPGSLSLQYRDPKNMKGAYHQLSYTRAMKSRTEHVPTAYLPALRRELRNYQHFKELIDEWIGLSIEESRLRMKQFARPPGRPKLPSSSGRRSKTSG